MIEKFVGVSSADDDGCERSDELERVPSANPYSSSPPPQERSKRHYPLSRPAASTTNGINNAASVSRCLVA